jgi:hypothetical protein
LLIFRKFLKEKKIILLISDLPEEYEELFLESKTKRLFFSNYSKIFYITLYNLRYNLFLILPNYRFEKIIRLRCPSFGSSLKVLKHDYSYYSSLPETSVLAKSHARINLQILPKHKINLLYAGTFSVPSFFIIMINALGKLMDIFEFSSITLFVFGKGEFFKKIYKKSGKGNSIRIKCGLPRYAKKEILMRVIDEGKHYKKYIIDGKIVMYLSPYVSEEFLERNAKFFDMGLLTFVPGTIYNYLLTTKKLFFYMKLGLPIVVPSGSYAQELLEKLRYAHVAIKAH